MRHFFMRFQLLLVSVVLLATFAMLMAIVLRYNRRWDFTREKVYSLSEKTQNLLASMQEGPIEVLAFYPRHDPSRDEFEMFLKEAEIQHPNLTYLFYDPERRPQLADHWHIREHYTVILRYKDRHERIVRPDEKLFATALLKLREPKSIPMCFAYGHGEARISGTDDKGLSLFVQLLRDSNYPIREMLLVEDDVPKDCRVVVVPGPQREWKWDELNRIKAALVAGQSVLFLIDPMDRDSGVVFYQFLKEFGVRLGRDVIVDKMSRVVGGDFLVPFVNQYGPTHELTRDFDQSTFFPVTRTVNPGREKPEGVEVAPIAFSGSNSWAETHLVLLEQGEAIFEAESDTPGPLSLAVALQNLEVERGEVSESGERIRGRMVVVGDSDFMTNAYIDLSGNRNFALRLVQWLTRDDRVVHLEDHFPQFQPLILSRAQRRVLLSATLAGGPMLFLIPGTLGIIWRKRRK